MQNWTPDPESLNLNSSLIMNHGYNLGTLLNLPISLSVSLR